MINLHSTAVLLKIMVNDLRDLIEEEERGEVLKYLESALVNLTIAFSDVDLADQLLNKDYGENDEPTIDS